MYTKLVNLRISKGYGTEKLNEKKIEENGAQIEGEFEWIDAPPKPKETGYGDPPEPVEGRTYDKYFETQKMSLSKSTTADMLYKRFLSAL